MPGGVNLLKLLFESLAFFRHSTPAMTTANHSDASLNAFVPGAGKLAMGFWGERLHHTVLLPSRVDSLTFTAAPTDSAATLTLDGQPLAAGRPSVPLSAPVGRSMHVLEVTAADGAAKRAYHVKVLRSQPLLNWVRLLEHGPFTARDSAGEAVHQERMWLLGGYIPELVNDVWASRDGVAWTQTGTIPDESGINIPVCLTYAGKLWISTQSGKFFNSPDGATWTLVTDQAPWRGRYAPGSAVFAGKMWVMGGHKDEAVFNDVWSSTDGVRWTLELENAPWSRRQLFGNLVAHNDRLFVVGGGVTCYQPFRAYTDVWSSPDGVNWTLVMAEAPFAPRIWSSVLSYRGRLWLLGGYQSEPGQKNFNDLWYSADGKEWHRLETEDIWSERHEVSPYVHDGRLWVVAGNAWPLMNDVWALRADRLTFVTQPVIEEFVGTRYRYRASADFGAAGSPVRYRLAQGPAWLTLDAATGLLEGTPPAEGNFAVELEAANPAGARATQAFTLHVTPVR